MSEPSSFFAEISITQEKMEEFLNAKPEQSVLNENWAAWWESRKMYGKTVLTQKNLRPYDAADNRALIELMKNDEYSPGFSNYDTTSKTWHFGIPYFSENYIEILPILSFIKSVANYKTNNPDDFAIIYNCFFGGEVMAYMDYANNEAKLDASIRTKDDVNSEKIKHADAYLSRVIENISD